MTQGESPTVARRRLRLALRQAREAKGFTQGQVADHLDWSLSKVQRIESGDVTVSSTDLKAFLADVGVGDLRRVSELVDLARLSRTRRGFWDEPKFRSLTPSMKKLFKFESEAGAIRMFHPSLLPGVFQTQAYSEIILDFWRDELPEEDRAVRIEARQRRRDEFLNHSEPANYLVALDESVLHRIVGNKRIMAEQLQDMLSIMKRPNVTVRIVPYTAGAFLVMLNSFVLIDLGDEENAVLYREAQLVDDVDETHERTKRYRSYFERLWGAALSEEASARLVDSRAKTLLSELDREPSTH